MKMIENERIEAMITYISQNERKDEENAGRRAVSRNS